MKNVAAKNQTLFAEIIDAPIKPVKKANIRKKAKEATGKLSAIINTLKKDENLESEILRKLAELKKAGKVYNPDVYTIYKSKRFYAFVKLVIDIHPNFHYLSAKVKKDKVTGAQIGGLIDAMVKLPKDTYKAQFNLPLGYPLYDQNCLIEKSTDKEFRKVVHYCPGFNDILSVFNA